MKVKVNLAPKILNFVFAGLCSLGLLQASQATLFSDDEARAAIMDVRKKVDDANAAHDKAMADLTAKLGDLTKRVERFEATESGSLELAGQVDSLRSELAKLRGSMEQMANDIAAVQRAEKDRYGDMDSRIKTLEPQTVSVDGHSFQADHTEQSTYDAALNLFRQSDFRSAITSFQSFLSRYPNSGYAPSAQYWLGNSYYALKDYKNALNAQSILVEQFSTNVRVPDAMLNMAACYTEMGDKVHAKLMLKKIQAEFAGSEAAKIAQDRLAALH